MGQTQSVAEAEEDYPWIWAIREVEQLDFRRGLSREQVATLMRKQAHLPVEILPEVYLSNARCAHDVEHLRALRVTHVLNVAGAGARAADLGLYRRVNMRVLELDGRDEEGFPMVKRYLGRARRFIDLARQAGGKVVVHCVAGLNRSGLVVAAEYMLQTRCSVLTAVAHCRKQRGNMCLCNRSFQAQLVALARLEGLLGPPPGHPDSVVPNLPPSRPGSIAFLTPVKRKTADLGGGGAEGTTFDEDEDDSSTLDAVRT